MASKSISFMGYKCEPWQADVHRFFMNGRYSAKIGVVKSHRQCGKSMMCENQLLYYALNFPNSINAMISPTLNQSRKVFKELSNALAGTGVLRKKNESLLEMEFINGSTIFFKSAEQKEALRGYTITGILILDEATFLPDDVLELVLPWTTVHKAPILIVSTPKTKNGFFYRYYARGLTGDSDRIKSFDWNQYDTSKYLSYEQKMEMKALMPKTQFLTEVMGEFADDDASVFSGFRECIREEIPKYKKLYIGIDFANQTGNDDTVITALNERGEQVMLYYFNNKTSSEQIDFICRILEENRDKVACVVPELNSLGTPLTDMIKERCGWCNIQGHTTTNKSKNDIVNNLQVAFERRHIGLINDEKQCVQLSTYAMEFNPRTRVVTYNAPQGLHDDCCIALALAWKAYNLNNNVGNYSFSTI